MKRRGSFCSHGRSFFATAMMSLFSGFAILLVAVPTAGDNLTLYQEDFTNDPNYWSPEPANCYWDAVNGWYVANVYDVSSGIGHDYGLSPPFAAVADASFHVEFDMNITLQDWGSYPGIVFVDGSLTDPLASFVWQFFFFWADTVPKEFALYDTGGTHWYRSPRVAKNTWYRVVVDYDHPSGAVDVILTLRDTGEIFWELEDQPFLIAGSFDTVAIGQRTAPPKYGRLSTEHIDNILVALVRGCEYGPSTQPMIFTRGRGKPVVESAVWESCGGPGTATISLEDVSSGWVFLNGEMLLAPDDFNPHVVTLVMDVSLIEGANIIEVELAGKPGSRISVEFQAVE